MNHAVGLGAVVIVLLAKLRRTRTRAPVVIIIMTRMVFAFFTITNGMSKKHADLHTQKRANTATFGAIRGTIVLIELGVGGTGEEALAKLAVRRSFWMKLAHQQINAKSSHHPT